MKTKIKEVEVMKTLENVRSKREEAITVLMAYRAGDFSEFEKGRIIGYADAMRSNERFDKEVQKGVN